MTQENRKRRYLERWVDCAAAEAAYVQLSTQQHEFKRLTELGRGLLARIRGRGKKGIILHTTLMQVVSIEAFADRCKVACEAMLANGDGMDPLKAVTAPSEFHLLKAQVSDDLRTDQTLTEVISGDIYYKIYSNGMLVQKLELSVSANTERLFVVYPITFPNEVTNIQIDSDVKASSRQVNRNNCWLVFPPMPKVRKIKLILSGI